MCGQQRFSQSADFMLKFGYSGMQGRSIRRIGMGGRIFIKRIASPRHQPGV